MNRAFLYLAYTYLTQVQGPSSRFPMLKARICPHAHTHPEADRVGVFSTRLLCPHRNHLFRRHSAAGFPRRPLAPGCSENITSILVLMHYRVSARK